MKDKIKKIVEDIENGNLAFHDAQTELFDLLVVSNRRELLIGYIMNEQRLYCGKPDRELSEQLADDYIANL